MKKYKFILMAACIAAVSMASSCEPDPVSFRMGSDRLTESQLSAPALTLRCVGSSRDVSMYLLTEGGSEVSGAVYVSAPEVVTLDQAVVVSADTSLVSAYSTETGVDYQPLPAPFYELENGGVLTIPAGKNSSDQLNVTFFAVNSLGNQLDPGLYLLPLRATASSEELSDNVRYLIVKVREPYEGNAPLYTGDDFFFVFYLNTSDYDPRLMTDYCVASLDEQLSELWYCTIGNIINLRKNTVGYDSSTGQVKFSPSADMKYVLSHYSTYILPLQEEGRKVCLSIEGGGVGIGFCNMTDSQIEDFVSQVKLVMDMYPLDGINLWDRNSSYDKSTDKGFPEMNTTSYPKLIKALREMLGEDKLLTLADYEEPTEYFWDTEATGGIAVGDYVDYAWSGYYVEEEGYQVVDPYHQGELCVSVLHPRKPIAGLDSSRYGCVNSPWMPDYVNDYWDNTPFDMITWAVSGWKNSNILVFEDARTNLQDTKETSWHSGLEGELSCFMGDSGFYSFDLGCLYKHTETWDGTYGKWLKTW